MVRFIVILSQRSLRSEEPALRERKRPSGIWASRAVRREAFLRKAAPL
jgi:hypothetical protein